MKPSRSSSLFAQLLVAASFALVCLLPATANAQTDLFDQPSSQPKVPNNLLLSLSVEYPTAVAVAYPYVSGNYTSATCNNGGSSSSGSGKPYCNLTTSTYLGYFDPTKCYSYYTSTTDANAPYFVPYGNASVTSNGGTSGTSGYTCTSSTTNQLWSGNWLNWASMQTIDVFRWALTGGYRSIDTTALTVLQKGWSSNQGSFGSASNSDTPDKSVSRSADISGATPFTSSGGWSTLNTRIGTLGYVMWVSSTNANMDETNVSPTSSTQPALGLVNGTGGSLASTPVAYNGQNSYVSSSNSAYANPGTIYALQIRVQVCDTAKTVESNCTYYGANSSPAITTDSKPEGLIQQYALSMRFAAMGYLDDSNTDRDAGVLRASMKFVGPMQPVIGSSNISNSTLAEWSGTTGIFATNPSPNDITLSATSPTPAVTNSGVVNYLNKFGMTSGIYKSSDPVSELYYAGIRYFENIGTSGVPSGAGNSSPAWGPWVTGTSPNYTSGNLSSTFVDGFPVITTWADPILYACQFNYILGIGDVNTHTDANIPGSNLTDANEVSAMPVDNILSAVSYSGQTGVGAADAMIAQLENFTGVTGWAPCCTATYEIAGLAYYAHTNDIRPNDFNTTASGNLNPDGSKIYTQSINSTYWLDVQEYQTYVMNNQYYLATKWGGFTVPTGFQPWATTNTNTSYVPQLTTTVNGITTETPMSVASWYTNGGLQGNTTSSSCSSTTPNSGNDGGSAVCNWQPDNYFSALDARGMVTGLQSAFSKASSGGVDFGTAFSSTSANLTSSTTTNLTYSYKSKYNPSGWSGDVIGNTVVFSAAGVPTYTQIWDAATILNGTGTAATTAAMATLASNRVIVTCCQSSSPTSNTFTTAPAAGSWGFPFEATATTGTSLSTTTFARTNYASFSDVPNVASANEIPANFVAYLRGDREHEVCVSSSTTTCTVTNGYYRSRTTLLGDIIDSQLTAVGAPSALYSNSSNPGYSTFVTTYASRKQVVYVGANDGMMHAFDGTNASTGGKELFAYIPSFVYGCDNTTTCSSTSTPSASTPVISSVNGLTSLGNTTFTHHYLVDSTPVVTDIDLNNTGGSNLTSGSSYTSKWASVLIGGLGKGGHGYYAIDVTDPTTWTSETAVAGKVLWEFTDSRMGDSYGTPVVVKTAQYGWVAILTSGYNNADGNGYFFIVNAATGQLLQAIEVTPSTASATNQTGLAHPTAYVNDYTNYTADAVYAADLLGDLWRLDLTPSSGAYTATQIATLDDPSGNPQPVTTDPYPDQQPNTLNRYVFVGTGRLLGTSDTSSTQIQTFYAIIDGKTTVGGFYGSNTTENNTPLPSGVSFPITRANMVDNTNLSTGITLDTTKPMGWYADLPTDPTTGVAARVTVDPQTYYGIVAFAGNLPTGVTAATACYPGGSAYNYATTFATGVSALVDPNNSNAPINYSLTTGLTTQLQFQNINGQVFLESGSSTGAVNPIPGSWISNGNLHRVNWREVPTSD